MTTIYVARSAALSDWASDVGQSKHVFKLGIADVPVKPLVEAGWAGFPDWVLLRHQPAESLDAATMLERMAAKFRMLDPKLYPRLRGTLGVFKVLPAQVENHLVIQQALGESEGTKPIKVKPADYADFLILNALRAAPAG